MIVLLKTERLSVCPCGFPILDESIELGTEYLVDMSTVKDGGFVFRCGGCGTVHRMTSVNVSQRLHPNRPMAPLPMVIFENPNLM